ncbi:MAG: hypothetical protein U5K37_04980 [Natrialbaceae archaeon]|nr:hypothetical protein [Natrialbaceae archaeon]
MFLRRSHRADHNLRQTPTMEVDSLDELVDRLSENATGK